jgi:DNA-directed RNA polymerase subunit RPC12/RpoP
MRTLNTWLLILVILGCATWLIYYYASQPDPGETEQHLAPLACTGCGKAYIGMIGDEPGKCHYCRKETVWLAHKCMNPSCGAIVPWVRDLGFDSVTAAGPDKCPKCGGDVFGEVSPDEIKKPE